MLETKMNTIEGLLKEAGDMIQDMLQDTLQIESKSQKDWVTNIDKTVEKFLVDNIIKHFPESNFLTEEDTVALEGLSDLWIIDPIDGTTNLINQKKNFTISIAHFNNGEPLFGFVYDVMMDRMYRGVTGQEASVNNTPILIDHSDRTLENAVLYGDIFRPNFFKTNHQEIKDRIATHRFLGSAALEICEVAMGYGVSYTFPKISIWDAAAALIILKCTGGTWYFGNEHEGLPMDNNKYVILACANETILEEIKTWL